MKATSLFLGLPVVIANYQQGKEDETMTTETTTDSTTATADSRRWQILGVLCVALFAIVMDNTIVNVALPTLARELGAGTSGLQWIVDAYTLVFAGLLLAAGGLGDRFGRKPALIAGSSRSARSRLPARSRRAPAG